MNNPDFHEECSCYGLERCRWVQLGGYNTLRKTLGCLFAKALMERSFIDDDKTYFIEKLDGKVE